MRFLLEMRQETKQILESVNATPFGKALQEFLDDQFEELNNVQACKSWEDTLGRQHAIAIIEKLFSFMKPNNSANKVQRTYE